MANTIYEKKCPSSKILSSKHLFAYCIVYLVVQPDKTIRLEFKFPEDMPLKMEFLHKRPGGANHGEAVSNIDIREVTNIFIPPYDDKYYFNFILFVLDITVSRQRI